MSRHGVAIGSGTTTRGDGGGESARERGLSSLAQRIAAAMEKWFPDAFVFALVGLVLVAVLALVNGASVVGVAQAFGAGFWNLIAFTLQMAMVVLTGYVVASSRPIARAIDWLARRPRTGPGAIAFVALCAMLVSLLNWGLSLIASAFLARAVARRTELKADYRALSAAAFMGLGTIWALGLSSSAAQLQATPASLTDQLLRITGVLDFSATLFTWQSGVVLVSILAVATGVAWATAPRRHVVTAADMGVDLTEAAQPEPPRTRPGEWLEYSRILPALIGLLALVSYVDQFATKPALQVLSSLNGYLLVFLVLGMVLHGTPRRFMAAVGKAVPSTAGILVQFPLYAAIAGILTNAQGRGGTTLSSHLAGMFGSAGSPWVYAIVVVVYTVILGLFVPSGGGRWLIEAPTVMQTSTSVGLNLGWTVQTYNAACALPLLINPFFMLPLLSVMKVKARDLVGFTFVQMVFLTPVVLLLTSALSTTFAFQPPVVP